MQINILTIEEIQELLPLGVIILHTYKCLEQNYLYWK